jgi:hypothetical protein
MNTPIRSYKTMFRASVVASTTALAALAFAGVAAADGGTIDQPVGGSQCGGQPSRCASSQVPFNLDAGNAVEVTFTKNNNPCTDLNVQVDADGATQLPLGAVVPLAAGNHTINVTPTCSTGLSSWGGTVHISRIKQTGKPKPAPGAPAGQPLQNPVVASTPGVTGVTFHVTDHSGVASQCTYASEGFTSNSFSLPANGTFDLFVPAIREFRNRTGIVTCDNGTRAGTSAIF